MENHNHLSLARLFPRLSPLTPWGPAQGLHTEDAQEMFAGCWQAGKMDMLVEGAGDDVGTCFLSQYKWVLYSVQNTS